MNSKFYRLASIEHFTEAYFNDECGFEIQPLSGFTMTYESTISGYPDVQIEVGTVDPSLVTSVGTVTISGHVVKIDASIFDKDEVF